MLYYSNLGVKSLSCVLKFNEQLSFENTGERTRIGDILFIPWLEEAKTMKDNGMSLIKISEEFKNRGFKNVSRSNVHRKL